MDKKMVITAASLILLAIVLGAFGAHALKEIVSAEKLTSFETGVRYQMYTGIALLVIGLNAEKIGTSIQAFFILQLLGIVLFSLSIYLLALQDAMGVSLRFLGPVTPIGGMLLIISWIVFILKLSKSKVD
jgi:uncharacterized membrane protein YgdD (TMEM256/DUF423 family)